MILEYYVSLMCCCCCCCCCIRLYQFGCRTSCGRKCKEKNQKRIRHHWNHCNDRLMPELVYCVMTHLKKLFIFIHVCKWMMNHTFFVHFCTFMTLILQDFLFVFVVAIFWIINLICQILFCGFGWSNQFLFFY